jgi:hypothetical protein
MSKRTDEGTGTTDDSLREDGSAGVSERSERDIEASAADGDESDDEGDGEGDEGERDADDKGDPQRAITGLRKRIQKLTAQRNQSRSEAAELKAAKAELQRYRDAEAAARREREEAERNTPEGRKREDEAEAIRAAIDRAYGPGTSARLDRQHEIEAQQRAAHAEKAREYLRDELEAHGIKATPEAMLRWERSIGSELDADEEVAESFRHPATLKDTIEKCVDRIRDGLVNPALESRGAEKLKRIERKREAVLGGSSRKEGSAPSEEPNFDFKPPENATPEQLENFWRNAREKTWRDLASRDA